MNKENSPSSHTAPSATGIPVDNLDNNLTLGKTLESFGRLKISKFPVKIIRMLAGHATLDMNPASLNKSGNSKHLKLLPRGQTRQTGRGGAPDE